MTRSAQIPSLRILPSERRLIESAARAHGQTVTDWARNQLLRLAKEQQQAKPNPNLKLVSSNPRKGLELDDETLAMLSGRG